MNSIYLSRARGGVVSAEVVIEGPKTAIPFEKWPLWAKAMSLLRKSEDVGIGDTVRRTIGDANSKKFQVWYQSTFGKSCGCARRHRDWNIQYSYERTTPESSPGQN